MSKKDITYFNYSEFDSPDMPGSGEKFMNKSFLNTLDKIRSEAGFPFKINSGYRTKAHNQKVGGSANSSHTRGFAVDIAAPFDWMKRKIAVAAIRHGITRIGWANSFIHIDADPILKPKVVWNYGNSSPSFSELDQIAKNQV